MEKHTVAPKLRLRVGLLSYLFPSLAASRFNLEAPFSLEEACERLEKLEDVRGFREEPQSSLLFQSKPFSVTERSKKTVRVNPIEVGLAPLDADTYRYQVSLDEDQFRVIVRGYLKRWEAGSTVVSGRVWFDIHYLGLLVRSFLFAAIGYFVLNLFYAALSFAGFIETLANLNSVIFQLLSPPTAVYTVAIIWLVIFTLMWFNAVVFPTQIRRGNLMMRLEDMLLYPYLGS